MVFRWENLDVDEWNSLPVLCNLVENSAGDNVFSFDLGDFVLDDCSRYQVEEEGQYAPGQ